MAALPIREIRESFLFLRISFGRFAKFVFLDDSRKFCPAKVSRYTVCVMVKQNTAKCDNWQLLINEAWLGFGWQEIDKTLDLGYIVGVSPWPAILFDPPSFRLRTITH